LEAIAFKEYGTADVLEKVQLEAPQPGPSQLLVRVHAAGINPADWRIRNGQFRRALRIGFPFVPGSDIAGTVVAVGADAKRFREGDAIFAMLPVKQGGGYADLAVVDENAAAAIPRGSAWDLFGATPLAGLTAWQGLVKQGRIENGQSVLINGASGGVGHFAVQIARALGAKVTAITSSRNVDFVGGLGAAEAIDYTREDAFRGPRRFDIVFDTIATQPFRRWSSALKKTGVVVTVNPIVGKILPRLVTGMLGVNRLASFFVEPDGNDLSRLAELIAGNQVIPHIQETFSLAQAADAQRLSEAGHVRGKLVLPIGR
jgi:NADPH:quinone reductase-like Zn-dependent oxidoreductase